MLNTSLQSAMDQYAADCIRCRVRSLVGIGSIRFDEVDDICQDLTVIYLRKRSAFNPDRGGFRTFVSCVIDTALATVLAARHRDKARWHSFESGPGYLEAYSPEQSTENTELRCAVTQVLAGLHPQLRTIAALLASDTPIEVARKLGKSRTSIYSARKDIRRALERGGFQHNSLRTDSERRCVSE